MVHKWIQVYNIEALYLEVENTLTFSNKKIYISLQFLFIQILYC